MRSAATGLLGALLFGVALLFGSPSLLVPGIALLGLAILAVVWTELAAVSAAIEREAGPPRVTEGDSYPLALQLRRGLVPPPGGEVADGLLESPVRIGPFRPRGVDVAVVMPRRGRHSVAGAEWTIGDPLGLHSRTLRADGGGEILVLPRIEEVCVSGPASVDGEGLGTANAGEEGAAAISEARAVELEVDGLRPYRDGSPASRIHWPAFARSGELHERRILAGSESAPLVALDAAEPADEEALDRAVRAAASLAFHLATGPAGCAVLLPGSRGAVAIDRRRRGWPALHALLAVVGPGAPTRLPPGAAGPLGSVFWVTATGPGPPSAPRLPRSGSHYVVSAFRPEAGEIVLEVAGCFGVRAGAPSRARAKARAFA